MAFKSPLADSLAVAGLAAAGLPVGTSRDGIGASDAVVASTADPAIGAAGAGGGAPVPPTEESGP